MTSLTIAKKKEWAQMLFVSSNKTQKEIAATVNTTEKTLSNWIKKYKWDVLKAIDTITKAKERNRLLIQINEINNTIEGREEGKRFATTKEADILSKLAATVNNLDTNTPLNIIIDVLINMLEWLRNVDFKLAQEFSKAMDEYIKTKLVNEA